jgi:hypothetical protein
MAISLNLQRLLEAATAPTMLNEDYLINSSWWKDDDKQKATLDAINNKWPVVIDLDLFDPKNKQVFYDELIAGDYMAKQLKAKRDADGTEYSYDYIMEAKLFFSPDKSAVVVEVTSHTIRRGIVTRDAGDDTDEDVDNDADDTGDTGNSSKFVQYKLGAVDHESLLAAKQFLLDHSLITNDGSPKEFALRFGWKKGVVTKFKPNIYVDGVKGSEIGDVTIIKVGVNGIEVQEVNDLSKVHKLKLNQYKFLEKK